MNWNIIEGQWKELTGAIREKWGELTEDEITQLEGKRDRLEGLIQKKYGLTQRDAARQIDEWAEQLKEKIG